MRDRLRQASTITDARLSAARTMNTRWKAALDVIWGRVELLAVPTLLGFPPLIDDAQSIFGIRGVTTPVNAAGLPALVLPVPAAGGPRAANGPLPASVQLIGPAQQRGPAAGGGLGSRACGALGTPPGPARPDPGAIAVYLSYAETRSQTKIRVSPGLIAPGAPRSP